MDTFGYISSVFLLRYSQAMLMRSNLTSRRFTQYLGQILPVAIPYETLIKRHKLVTSQ